MEARAVVRSEIENFMIAVEDMTRADDEKQKLELK